MIVKVMLVVVRTSSNESILTMNGERFFVLTVAYFGFLLSLEKDFVDQGSKPNSIKYICFSIEANETLLTKKNDLLNIF